MSAQEPTRAPGPRPGAVEPVEPQRPRAGQPGRSPIDPRADRPEDVSQPQVTPSTARTGPGPEGISLTGLRAGIEADVRRLEGEGHEIGMLMQQVLVEIERHESRRTRMEARLAALETNPAADPGEVTEVRDGLLALTRRELLFDAQRQVLEGKQRVLTRYQERLVEIGAGLAALGDRPGRPTPVASVGLRPLAAAAGGSGAPGLSQPAMVMRDQEDLRRDIARQLHDGPAQSIANIGLQAEIVERMVQKGDPRAVEEVEALRRLVQQALDATKAFIFEIRPMVLDDLGLAPTIRRIASDRSRRSGIVVDFDSQGTERRLDPDIESAVYRSVDEALAEYLALEPPSVLVRLDWGERELVATVAGMWPRRAAAPPASDEPGGGAADTPPALLAMMEEKRSAEREAERASRALPPERVAEIGQRARALGLSLAMREEGMLMELVAPIRR